MAEMAMLPSKEAKEILYTLLAESFVSLQVKDPSYCFISMNFMRNV